ncbi:major facilitator superfamily domain-containing protein 1-like, partial [Ylistrum balloti]|uniref:major facilitator superfamily domain-containing protein 1-like n=1 Tax=Ylistrum balloti TaxID=509963 RepID=UPI002905E9E3
LEQWRPAILFFNSFMVLGTIFVVDMPTALQHEVINSRDITTVGGGTNNTNTENACKVCLGLGAVRYNLLHSSLRWTSAILSLPVGYLIDRLGNGRSAILLTSLQFLGSILFAVSAVSHAPIVTAMYAVMVAGRILLAFGETPLCFVQGRVVAHWFSEESLLPLSFIILSQRGGSILTFYVSATVADKVGFGVAVWSGACLCGLGVISAICLAMALRKIQMKQASKTSDTNRTTFSDIKAVPRKFWVHVCMIALLYGQVISFHANLPEYLLLQYGFSPTTSSYITGSAMLPFVVGPLVAMALNKIDCIGILVTCAAVTIVPVFSLLGFCHSVHPLFLTISLGFANCVTELGMWQVAVLLVPRSCFGTVTGIMYLVRNVVIGLTLLLDGYLLQKHDIHGIRDPLEGYHDFFLALVMLTSLSVLCGILLNVWDINDTCAINQRLGRWKHKTDEKSSLLQKAIEMDMTEKSPVGDGSMKTGSGVADYPNGHEGNETNKSINGEATS